MVGICSTVRQNDIFVWQILDEIICNMQTIGLSCNLTDLALVDGACEWSEIVKARALGDEM
jgi:hypothetical protein